MKAIDDFYKCKKNFSNELIPRHNKGEFTLEEWKRLTDSYKLELSGYANELIRLRSSNDPEVLYTLGEAFIYGWGVEKDRYLGNLYMAIAANAGHTKAMVWIGRKLINSGETTIAGETEALSWVQRAATAGCTSGMFELGFMYREGRGGLTRDYTKAAEWFEKEVEAGRKDSRVFLAKHYYYYLGDPDKALPILLEEAANEKSDTYLPLGQIYSDTSSPLFNYDKAVYWFERMISGKCEGSANSARLEMAKLHLSGERRPKDLKTAKECLEQVVLNSAQKSYYLREAQKLLKKTEKENSLTDPSGDQSSLGKIPPPKVTIRALWGNDAAQGTIKISPRQWKRIQAGEEFQKQGWGYYEGQRFSVSWYFNNRKVTIYADDQECIIDDPIENLYLD